jgi:hypothetical protein
VTCRASVFSQIRAEGHDHDHGYRKICNVDRTNKKIMIFLAVMIGVFTFVYVNGQHHTAPPPPAPPRAASSNEIWIIGRQAIQQLENNGASPALIKLAFDNNHTFVYGDTPTNRYPPSPIGVPTLAFGSYAGIAQAFENGVLPGGYKAVLYDNEQWAATPLIEQEHPKRYMAAVAHLLHEHGLLYIAAPAPDLMDATGKPADSYNAFLNAGIPADAAKFADILDLQAQVRETNVTGYSAFVQLAAEQARAANPHIKVVVGIRTNPGEDSMIAAYRATSSFGEGYWLNINGIPSPAVALLQELYRVN